MLFYTVRHCRDTGSSFNETMGSYDGAEICELVGIYLLLILAIIIDENNFGLYFNDGLILLWNANGQKINHVRKNVIKIFKEVDCKIEIQTHLKIVKLTFSLANGTYRLYRKPNNSLLYINTSSNLSPQVIKKLLTWINKRLTINSSISEISHASKYESVTGIRNGTYQQPKLIFNKI